MKTNLLYTFLLPGVLLFSGCRSEQVENEGTASPSVQYAPADSTYRNHTGLEQAQRMDNSAGRIVFMGDSITAGYGLSHEEAFPSLIQDRIDELGIPFVVVNAGISGDTSTGGASRIGWILRNPVDILVVELGGNDGLRGIPPDVTRASLRQIIRSTLESYPDCRIIVAGMQVPPNIGHEYTATFRSIFPEVAEEFGAALIPFVLEGVGGIPELNQPDGIHPTAEGHQIVAETVWKILKPEINRITSGSR